MRLSLIGCSSVVIDAISSAKWPPSLQINAYIDEGSDLFAHLGSLPVETHAFSAWQSSLSDPETVFVVTGEPPSIEALRLLAQSGLPAIVTHPACSMIDGFQLQMIQSDSEALIQPYCIGINHPLWDELDSWIADGDSPIGQVKQFTVHRPIKSGSKHAVLEQFTRDALQMRRLLGRVELVNAIGIENVQQSDWSSLSVQMVGRDGLVARWSAAPAASGMPSRLELIGGEGIAEAEMPSDVQLWALRVTSPEPLEIELPETSGFEALVQRFDGGTGQPLIDRDWDHACRAGELADAVEQSCRRGKTIRLHHEQHTEESTFKGIMAAGGCLMLLGLLGFVTVLQAIQTLRPGVADWVGWTFVWRGLFVLFFGFLLLQTLRLVFRSAADE